MRIRILLLCTVLLATCDSGPTQIDMGQTAPQYTTLASYSTDFGSYESGVLPLGWTQVWDVTPYFVVAEEPAATGGKALQWSADGTSRNRWGLMYDGLGDLANQEVYTEFRVRSLGCCTTTHYMGSAAVRMGGTATDEHGYAVFFVSAGTERSIVLSTWVGGGYLQFASLPFAWQLDEWYSVRLEATGTTIRARVWSRGTTEPANWDLAATDNLYATGKPGVANHDNGTVQWDVWQVQEGSTPPPPPPGVTFAFNFGEDALGSFPTGWSETAYPANSEWAIAEDLTTPDQRVLRNTVTVVNRHILRLNAVPDTTAQQETLTKFRLANINDRGPGLALRHTMNGASENAYVAYVRPDLDRLEIDRFVNGGWADLGSVPFVNDPGVWYWMRFRADGNTLRVKVWADGTSEPAGWNHQIADGNLLTGSVGLYTYEPNVTDYDFFTYASAGGAAPDPVQPPPPPPPPPPPLTYLTNFGEYSVGTQPVRWSTISTTSQWTVQAEANALDGYVLQSLTTTAGRSVLQADTVPITATDQEALIRLRLNDADDFGPGIALRHKADASNQNAYIAYLRPAQGKVEIGRFSLRYGQSANNGKNKVPDQFWAIAGTTFNSAPNTWYWLRFRAEGTTLSARAWADGTTEPSTWDLVATDTAIAAGSAGVYVAEPNTVMFDVFSAALGSATAPSPGPPPPPPPPPPIAYSTDFGEFAVNAQPTGWTETSAPSNSAWTVQADATALDGFVIRNISTATARHILRADAIPSSATDQELLTRFKLGDSDDRGPGLAVRHTMNGALETAYVAYLRPAANQIDIDRFLNGGWSSVGAASFSSQPGVWYWLRFRAEGTTLRARVWADGTAEPATWNVVVNDAGITSGSAGLYTYEPNTVDYDFFSAVAGAGTASVPAPPPPPPPVTSGYKTTFSEFNLGALPAGWSTTSDPSTSQWTIQQDATTVDGFVLRNVTTATARNFLQADSILVTTTDQEALVRLQMASNNDRGPGIALRHVAGGSLETAYVAYFRPAVGLVELNRVSSRIGQSSSTGKKKTTDQFWFIAAAPFPNQAGAWYWMRFRAEGSTLKVRVWADGGAEPATWNITSTDTAITSGSAGVYVYEPNTVLFDFFSAAAGSGTAVIP